MTALGEGSGEFITVVVVAKSVFFFQNHHYAFSIRMVIARDCRHMAVASGGAINGKSVFFFRVTIIVCIRMCIARDNRHMVVVSDGAILCSL